MSDHAAAAAHDSHAVAAAGTALSTPEFDQQERDRFGQDDGTAVTVIGKMLVGFFFYSLLVMSAVAWWTMRKGGQAVPPPPASHVEQTDE